jgi:hypothetical protein
MFTTVTTKDHQWTMHGKDLKSHMQKLVSGEKERSHVFWATNHQVNACNRLQEHEIQKWKIISSQKVRREGNSISARSSCSYDTYTIWVSSPILLKQTHDTATLCV